MRHGWIVAAFLLSASAARAQDAVTISFAQNHSGSIPRALSGEEAIKVDLSTIPPNTAIHRAVFRPGRIEGEAFTHRDVAPRIRIEGRDQPLALMAPRFTSFDVTEDVRRLLSIGRQSITITVDVFPGYQPPFNRLDVTCAAKPRRELPAVTALVAIHRDGQTLLTWKEPLPDLSAEKLTVRDWVAKREMHVVNSSRHRYRIYRSAERITAATIGTAEFVDEVAPLTGWNGDFYGISPKPDAIVPRYVVDDGQPPIPPGTAVYAHNPKAAGKAYYAVTLALDGEEDLTNFGKGALAEPVEETVGPGAPVLQRVEHPGEFNYVKKPELRYYVRWESPPTANLPSRPIDYLVALPSRAVTPAPVGLHLHCWGGSLDGGYGWWYNAAQGAVLISTNQLPYDWWTGYHENQGTWKSWRDGVVRDYTQARLMSFLDWASTQWKLDPARVFTAGSSMGGSGSPSVALRRADRVAWCVSWVGVHRPAESPQFSSSYERVYGTAEWRLLYQDRKTRAFEFFDDAAYVRQDPARETPLIVFANGKNDKAIGWEQAHEFWKALQETRRPHVFRWGQAGHGQRALMPGTDNDERELDLDVRSDRTLPAFTKCSLDENPGDGSPESGSREGQSNLYLVWETAPDRVVDEVGRWAMTLRLNRKAPNDEATVDVTPRRCFQFRTAAGAKVRWRNASADGVDVQSGEVAADRWGLVTAPAVKVTKSGNRLTMELIR